MSGGIGDRFRLLWEFVLTFCHWEGVDIADPESGGRYRKETYTDADGRPYVVETFDREPQRIVKPDGRSVVAGE